MAQSNWTTLHEDEVTPVLYAKHYLKYPESAITGWHVDRSGPNQVFRASFTVGPSKLRAHYTPQGKLLVEEMVVEQLPNQLITYLTVRFSKYKVQEFRVVKDVMTDEVSYCLDVKTKEAGELAISFDNAFNTLTENAFLAEN